MIKKLFFSKINSITIAAFLVALSSLISRFLGIFRDHILASQFGAGDILDVYYAAFRVPDLIFNLLVLGALSAGFIPVFTHLLKNKENSHSRNFFLNRSNKEAWHLANSILNILGLSLIFLAGLAIILAPYLSKIIAPGFEFSKQEMTIALTRIMMISPVLLGISSVFGGILQSFKRFFVYSLSPIFYNIGIIIGALYFVPLWGIYGLAWGVVFGAFMHLMVQVPVVFRLGFKYSPKIYFRDKNLKKIGLMMVPRTLSLAISQINLLVITIIASTLASGSLVIFNFANNLQSFPIGIFGISFAIAAFPTLSAVAFNKKKLAENFSRVFRQILFFIVPSTVLLITLRAQIVRVVFGAGAFNWQDTVLTINTLGYFAVSLFAQASLPLLIRMFYARHDAKIPFILGLISAVVNVASAIYFSRLLGVAGLALAFSIANIVNFVLLWGALKIELGKMDELRILASAVKFSGAAMAAGLSVQGMKLLVWPYVDMTKFWGVFTQGLFAGLTGIFVYLVFCFLFKSEEFFSFYYSFKRRLPWRKVETGDQGEARGI